MHWTVVGRGRRHHHQRLLGDGIRSHPRRSSPRDAPAASVGVGLVRT